MVLAGNGEAFVPQAPHLLHQMIQKINRPEGMVVHQIRNVMETSVQGGAPKTIELDEKLAYAFPGKFRSEIVSGRVFRFYVESNSQFVKVADGKIVSQEKSPVDFYSDILLYRDYESLLQQLDSVGVSTEQVSFQRFDNKICYFIGQPGQKESAGLWIERESLFPVRYVIDKNGWTVSFRYENWQQVSKTWYPMLITILVDNQLFARIEVRQFEISSEFPLSVFDVKGIHGMYPVGSVSKDEASGTLGKIDELDKQIENFRKLYE
ncbi:MAG: hypothetical protein KKC20_17520 [Proteobacteria bacterium]|nr:hypothetical protein [Pseudomonadota bacterium]